MTYLKSNHEEADTKIILHLLDATINGATKIRIHSPDTDVFVLALRCYPKLCKKTVFVTSKGQNHREFLLQPIVSALGPVKTAALPAFHALTGTGNSFATKGKSKYWEALNEASEEVISAISCLGTSKLSYTETEIEKRVCQFFLPKTEITSVKELRWWIFKKKQTQSEKLPPTSGALKQAILRAHYQLLVWNHDNITTVRLPSPGRQGWTWQNERWVPVMTTLSQAPDAIIHLVKCGCSKDRCTNNRCQCMKAGLNCAELCGCYGTGETECENMTREDDEELIDEILDLDSYD